MTKEHVNLTVNLRWYRICLLGRKRLKILEGGTRDETKLLCSSEKGEVRGK